MTQTNPNDAPVSVVVPARNEAPTIGRVVETLIAMPLIDEVVVVDNGSTDGTGDEAGRAGARVVTEDRPGMGHAIRAGYLAAGNDWVMKVDADLDRFNIALFSRMIEARAPGIGLIKGMWQDPRDPMPMTRYLVMPALRQMFPGLGDLQAPNSGIYAFDRPLIALNEIVGDYAADLDVMLRVHAAGAGVTEVDIGRIENNLRDGAHYSAMSDTIMGFLLRQRDLMITREILVLADDAAQVITGCLGTLAGHGRAGGRVSVFLGDAESQSAQVLRQALQGFPTAQVASLSGVDAHHPVSGCSGISVVVSGPEVGGRKVLQVADQLQARAGEAVESALFLMPAAAGEQAASADTGWSIAAGAAIKQSALNDLILPPQTMPAYESFSVLK